MNQAISHPSLAWIIGNKEASPAPAPAPASSSSGGGGGGKGKRLTRPAPTPKKKRDEEEEDDDDDDSDSVRLYYIYIYIYIYVCMYRYGMRGGKQGREGIDATPPLKTLSAYGSSEWAPMCVCVFEQEDDSVEMDEEVRGRTAWYHLLCICITQNHE
jgi:hypothetical protein